MLLVSLEWGAIAIACAFLTPPLLELILVHRKSSELSFSLFRQFTLIAGILAIFWAFRSNTSLALTQLAINLKQIAIAMCFPLNRCTAPMWENFWIIIAGIQLSASELNLGIRTILAKINAEPGKKNDGTLDQKEYSTGRAIGALERVLILLLFLSGNTGAVGLVVAAKGLIRFSELDDRSFAEYFLIGTLLSVTGSLAISIIVKWLMI